jgi:hypothetical protein
LCEDERKLFYKDSVRTISKGFIFYQNILQPAYAQQLASF